MSNPPVPDYVPDWNPSTIYTSDGPNLYAYEDGAVFRANSWMQGAQYEPVNNYSDPYYNPWTLVSGSVNRNPARPDAPTGVTSAYTSDRLIALTWNPAHVPGTGAVTGYDIFENGVKIGTSTSNHFTVAGLSGSTAYQFTVDAVDATGVSTASAVATLTTAPPVVSSGKVFSPYVDVGLDVDNDMLSIARATGHNDFTLAFLQNSVLASGTASISGDVLTVSDWKSGSFVSGYDISGLGVTPGTHIVAQTGGTPGKAGTYQLSTSSPTPVAPTTISESTVGWAGTGTIADDGFPAHAELPNIQSVVQTLQSQGGVITISFGGSSGTDPAVAEANFAKPLVDAAVAGGMSRAQARATSYAPYAAELQAQYQSVIDRYHVTHLDFDIEGGAVANQDSFAMRDMALVGLEAANPNLKVSFTLPVLPDGLDNNGRSVLAYAKADGLRLDSVNIMAMDYGANAELAGDANGGQMAQDAIQAATATHAQIQAAGLTATVGVTPMLGVNDDGDEIFTTANGRALGAWAAATPWVSSLGYWSVARDNDDTGQASLSDSGSPQARWEFSSIFSSIAVAQAPGDTLTVAAGTATTLSTGRASTGKVLVSGELDLGLGGSVAPSQQVALKAAGAVFDVSGAGGATVQELSGVAGSSIRLGSGMLSVNETVAATFSGVLSDGGVAGGTGGGLVVNGTAPLTLTAAQAYTGRTLIDGVLVLGAGASLASSSLVRLSAPGAVLDISAPGAGGATVTVKELSGAAGTVIGLGAGVLSVTETVKATYAGEIADGGSSGGTGGGLIVNGTAPLTLTGQNAFTGKTQIYGQLDLAGSAVLNLSKAVTLKSASAVFDISQTTGKEAILNLAGVAGSRIFLGANGLKVNQSTAATYAGVIADSGAVDQGKAVTDPLHVGGSLIVKGTATLTLTGANTFTGGVTLLGGSLELATPTAAGVGHALTFSGGGGLLTLDAGALSGSGQARSFGTTLTGFTAADHLDLAGLAYAGGATAAYSGSTLTVTSGAASVALTMTGLAPGAAFTAVDDGHGHVLVGLVGAG